MVFSHTRVQGRSSCVTSKYNPIKSLHPSLLNSGIVADSPVEIKTTLIAHGKNLARGVYENMISMYIIMYVSYFLNPPLKISSIRNEGIISLPLETHRYVWGY